MELAASRIRVFTFMNCWQRRLAAGNVASSPDARKKFSTSTYSSYTYVLWDIYLRVHSLELSPHLLLHPLAFERAVEQEMLMVTHCAHVFWPLEQLTTMSALSQCPYLGTYFKKTDSIKAFTGALDVLPLETTTATTKKSILRFTAEKKCLSFFSRRLKANRFITVRRICLRSLALPTYSELR